MQQRRIIDISEHRMSKFSDIAGVEIPQSVYARLLAQGSASPDPNKVTAVCDACGVIAPLRVAQGYVKRQCRCETLTRLQERDAIGIQQDREMEGQWRRAETTVDRCYTWLGEEFSEYGLDELTFENFRVKLLDANRKPLDASHEMDRAFAKERAMTYAEAPQGTLIIHGTSYGIGKTHLACAVLNYQRAQGHPGLFTTGANLFNALMAEGDNFQGRLSIITKMYSTPLLVIDDPDHATATEFRTNTYKEIFNKRFNRNLPTIITTNLQFGARDDAMRLKDVVGGAAASRLNKGLLLIGMRGEDYRKTMRGE